MQNLLLQEGAILNVSNANLQVVRACIILAWQRLYLARHQLDPTHAGLLLLLLPPPLCIGHLLEIPAAVGRLFRHFQSQGCVSVCSAAAVLASRCLASHLAVAQLSTQA